MLQLLDEGRLTDGQGRTVDFRHAVVIMTSNLGSELWSSAEGVDEAAEAGVRQLLTRHFRPEFLNRIDEVVVFHRLTRDELQAIVDLQVERVRQRLAASGYGLDLTPRAKEHLLAAGYDPTYGARPLKRAIQRELQDPLALRILARDFRPGDAILVDRGADQLEFTAAAAEVVA